MQSPNRKGMFVTADGRNVLFTFILVTSLFFLWGFCNGMIDTMDKHFQEVLHLTKANSAWVQFAHYLGYFIMSMPAGWLAMKLGYKGGIIAGLLLVALGGLWFVPATHISAFWAFLLGVCIIASGLTFLETVANPYTTVLGDQRYGATRINLAQSFNSIGSMIGPTVGGLFFYSKNAAGVSTGSERLYIPYMAVAVFVIVIALVFVFAPVPDIKTDDDYHLDDATPDVPHSIWAHPHFILAIAAQFFYVAAQAGIFSFFINYMTSQTPPIPASWASGFGKTFFEVANGAAVLSDKGGSVLSSCAMFFFFLGRVTGTGLLRKFAAHRVLALYGGLNTLVCLVVFCKLGWISVGAVFLSYFFMSIMFPTIFALGIFGLGVRSKRASAYIVMAIIGGALLPKLMGYIADRTDMSRGFILPVVCFAIIGGYALFWPKLANSEGMHGVDPSRTH